MGKFTGTSYSNTIDSLISATTDKFKNPYYKYIDKKPTPVTYYKINREKTTLDEGGKFVYENVGDKSPIKYNKIEGFYLYGIDRIQTDYDVGDYGLESSSIEGEAIVLPGTIVPSQGDFFVIPYIKEGICFRVTSITPDTLEDGSNLYQLRYVNEYYDIKDLEKSVVNSYKFIVDNVGTDFNTTILSADYELVEELENLLENMIEFFYELFFDEKVQTFCFCSDDGHHIYDPYLIEFIMRNNVMKYGSKFIFVDHQCTLPKTFSLNYSKSFFYALESRKTSILDVETYACTEEITDPNSLFVTRIYKYYKLEYFPKRLNQYKLEVIPDYAIRAIIDDDYFEPDSKASMFNLWTSYFNDNQNYIKGHIINDIRKFNWDESKDCFYSLPINIFIIENYIEDLLRKPSIRNNEINKI